MKAAIIGLGVEGKKALNSLLKYNWEIYGTDLNQNIDLTNFPISLEEINTDPINNKISFAKDNLSVDLGFNNQEKIDSCDAILLSPSIWKSEISKHYRKTGKLLSDVKSKHKQIFTIGVTGTNGKTTTVSMIKEILENAGKKVLVGGNGGGGFEGYYDLILEANENLESDSTKYDVLLVEVCDMTIDFCSYCFDFDIIALTNMGNDHMDVHGSKEEYKNSLINFFKDKTIVINEKQEFKSEFKKVAKSTIEYTMSDYKLSVFGNFNKLNAGVSHSLCSYINNNVFEVNETIIKDTLEHFKPVKGRLEVLKLNNNLVYIGKSDNSDAIKPILEEVKFKSIFIGTPRPNENHRLDILDEVVKAKPDNIVLFKGLADTIDQAIHRLNDLNYEGSIKIANHFDEIILLIDELSQYSDIFIGGNGQEVIIKIQDKLKDNNL